MDEEIESKIDNILKETFKKEEGFRNIQKQVILSILNGNDILAIMPTGSGKSLCFQLPAVHLHGTTFVFSPLIALMHDQVRSLEKYGITSVNLDSNLSKDRNKYNNIINDIKNGKYKIVYLAPERLQNPEIREITEKIEIPLVVVDEAHCVSEWGHDFRKEYQDIPIFVENIVKLGKKRPVVAAFTATATEETRKDILKMLKTESAIIEKMSVARTNLNLKIIKHFQRSRYYDLLNFVKERRGKNGIIYCTTRRKVRHIFRWLNENNINAVWYHGDEPWWKRKGILEQKRKEKEENFSRFKNGKTNVMVATTAFGMGIDKGDVHYTLHFQMPLSIESYYQAAGRAGRELEKAESVYYYIQGDYGLCKYILENNDREKELDVDPSNTKRKIELLDKFVKFAQTNKCLHQDILEYFGEDSGQVCGECSNCINVQIPIDEIAECEKRDGVSKAVRCCDCGGVFPIYTKEYLKIQENNQALPTMCQGCRVRNEISDEIEECEKMDNVFTAVICFGCGKVFPINMDDALHLQRNGWDLPKRCPECKKGKDFERLMRRG